MSKRMSNFVRTQSRCRLPMFSTATFVLPALLILNANIAFGSDLDPDHLPPPRQLYNVGTQKLRDGRLADAEAYLQGAVASQDARVQPEALYNLGHVRFRDGVNQLTNTAPAEKIQPVSDRASRSGTDAIRAVDDALAGEDVQAMVDAYQRGRGARKELKSAIEAVKRAMDAYGAVLTKWRRASGDFKSAFELRLADVDAKTNGDIVDRYIAQLVDMQRPLAASQGGLEQKQNELRKKMSKLKGKMPQEVGQSMPGDDGDDDDGDKQPKDVKRGQAEGPPRNGSNMQLTPEEAKRLLGLLRLDGDRKLDLGPGDEATKPKDRKGRDW